MPNICSNSVTRRVRPNGKRVGVASPAQWQQQAGTAGYDYVYACERVCVNVCFCYLLHILLPLLLSFTRVFIYCCLLECRYHLSVYFRHMCRRTLHVCTQTRTLTYSHPWRVASCHAPRKAVYALCAIERPNAMVSPTYKAWKGAELALHPNWPPFVLVVCPKVPYKLPNVFWAPVQLWAKLKKMRYKHAR